MNTLPKLEDLIREQFGEALPVPKSLNEVKKQRKKKKK